MNYKKTVAIGVAIAALYGFIEVKELERDQDIAVPAVLETKGYPIDKLNDNDYLYVDGDSYKISIGGDIVTLHSGNTMIWENDNYSPQLVVKTKADIKKPYTKNVKTYEECLVIVPSGYAQFVNTK